MQTDDFFKHYLLWPMQYDIIPTVGSPTLNKRNTIHYNNKTVLLDWCDHKQSATNWYSKYIFLLSYYCNYYDL